MLALSIAAHAQAPTVLSPAEVDAAQIAAKAVHAAEPLRLIRDHRLQSGALVAIFAGEFSGASERLKTRVRIVCTLDSPPWDCRGPSKDIRVLSQGIEQIFPLEDGVEQRAIEIVDYLNSPCFAPRIDVPKPRLVLTISRVQEQFHVRLQEVAGAPYVLEVSERGSPGGCAFRLTGTDAPGGARPPVAQKRTDPLENAAARERAGMLMGAAFLCGLAALILPWLGLLVGRWTAAGIAGILAAATTILFAIYDKDAISGNIRIDLLMIPALAFVAWVECAGFSAWAYARPSTGEPFSFAKAVRTIGLALAGILVTVIAAYFLMVSIIPAILGAR